MPTHPERSEAQGGTDPESEDLRKIREALAGLRFGEVTVIVQDGVVVQVERTERMRIKRGSHTPT